MRPELDTNATLLDLIASGAEQRANERWLREPRRDRDTTFGQLATDVARAATVLRARGVGPGDRVAVSIANRYEFYLAWFGANWLGAAFVPINLALRSRETEFILRDSSARLWILDDELDDVVEVARATVGDGLPPAMTVADLVADAESRVRHTSRVGSA